MKKTKQKIRLLQSLSFLFLFGPVVGVFIYNAKDYFSPETGFLFKQSIEVGIGSVLAAGAGVLLALGKTQVFKGSRGIGVCLLLAILLKAIIADLILILTAVFAGSLIHSLFKAPIAELVETYKYEKQATIQAKAMQNVMKEYTDIKAPPRAIEIHGRG